MVRSSSKARSQKAIAPCPKLKEINQNQKNLRGTTLAWIYNQSRCDSQAMTVKILKYFHDVW
jgi:hypothetical protein